ncbi:MBL fold metallo-hydrolase [Promicromonospora thailandica]|uniref:Glyoxylase, beta-lactamase superfamily II n=1 Tax=Promicromonospora thailandica TaxID=765201 RepID=A0A9X2G690_9MICO|nr:MBL fold metallo-hydrolase [Promicromonospora thailandica]MCP2266338.1 Glyoxylase, beta-lactamase superfamily II [Promicromonospora thailandica]BFF20011.1 MBL fold metallo-hydrolase [Promicromonospora thailandica]
MSNELHYEVMTERREGVTRDLPEGGGDLRWVANSATLIWGERDAVLVDTFTTTEQNDRLIEWVRAHDRTLAAVYVTHGHGDHAFGIGQLRAAFPEARFLATKGTLAGLRAQADPAYLDGFWEKLFPGQIPPVELPEVLDGDRFELEGNELRAIEVGHTDTEGSTVLWVPALGLLVGGDVVYNATYPYLTETTPASRLNWIDALERLRSLHPAHVVSGHKQPQNDNSPADLDATIRYLRDVDETAATSVDAFDFYRQLLEKQPGRTNVGSAWATAKLIKGAPVPEASA